MKWIGILKLIDKDRADPLSDVLCEIRVLDDIVRADNHIGEVERAGFDESFRGESCERAIQHGKKCRRFGVVYVEIVRFHGDKSLYPGKDGRDLIQFGTSGFEVSFRPFFLVAASRKASGIAAFSGQNFSCNQKTRRIARIGRVFA